MPHLLHMPFRMAAASAFLIVSARLRTGRLREPAEQRAVVKATLHAAEALTRETYPTPAIAEAVRELEAAAERTERAMANSKWGGHGDERDARGC